MGAFSKIERLISKQLMVQLVHEDLGLEFLWFCLNQDSWGGPNWQMAKGGNEFLISSLLRIMGYESFVWNHEQAILLTM